MKEKEFINIIKNTLNSELIGDDCAYLKDLGIVVTQDSLVEDVHFSRKFSSPYQLGYKSAMVNISDVCASGAKPLYLTVSLSLPDDIDGEFIKEFYKCILHGVFGVQTVSQPQSADPIHHRCIFIILFRKFFRTVSCFSFHLHPPL